jgi:hypothetical protein
MLKIMIINLMAEKELLLMFLIMLIEKAFIEEVSIHS